MSDIQFFIDPSNHCNINLSICEQLYYKDYNKKAVVQSFVNYGQRLPLCGEIENIDH
jgi:hypothetical protein